MPREDRDIATDMRERERDLVLNPRQYAYILDLTKGHVNVYVGPHKTSLANTDRLVRFSPTSRRFEECRLEDAIQEHTAADESSYVVLENPAADDKDTRPNSGSNTMVKLNYGCKVNIPGPVTFPLWPGQIAKGIPGHNLRSNQYLVVRVYNEEAAKANWGKAVVKAAVPQAGGKTAAPPSPAEPSRGEVPQLVTGQLLVIKGTEVSFYIPPTGIEVVPDEVGSHTRDAVTLERLEYCVLLDENGNRRYVRGPAVVFPRPTETFVRKGDICKFRAIELTESSGIYLKVIAPYEEGKRSYKEGEELFVTGKDQMIYFPRPEHSLIRYGGQEIHYGIPIPAGEARYVLDKDSGQISLVKGPQMFLADPRKQVIVRRVLSPLLAELMYPGNEGVIEYNRTLQQMADGQRGSAFAADRAMVTTEKEKERKKADSAASRRELPSQDMVQAWEMEDAKSEAPAGPSLSAAGAPCMELQAHVSKMRAAPAPAAPVQPGPAPGRAAVAPRKPPAPTTGITLDTKFDGAVSMNVWTGYAVLLVSRSGNRRVVVGPQTVLLEYDENPQVLELSTGTPKSDSQIIKTVYLRVANNKVSDMVEAVTKDLVPVAIRLSYRVTFEGDALKWFNVENYINFLCDHTRSLIRNAAKGFGIDEFNQNVIPIVRDTILGKTDKDNKRTGRRFDENGMRIYDVEVLDVSIGDEAIGEMLVQSQHQAVRQALTLAQRERELEETRRGEKIAQEIDSAKAQTEARKRAIEAAAVEESLKVKLAGAQAEAKVAEEKLKAKTAEQKMLDSIHSAELARQKASEQQRVTFAERDQARQLTLLDGEAKALTTKAGAITPQMIGALQSFGDKVFVEKLMEALGPHALLRGNTLPDVFAQLVNGTPELAAKLGDVLGRSSKPALDGGAARKA